MQKGGAMQKLRNASKELEQEMVLRVILVVQLEVQLERDREKLLADRS